jgi:hypothetical protein
MPVIVTQVEPAVVHELGIRGNSRHRNRGYVRGAVDQSPALAIKIRGNHTLTICWPRNHLETICWPTPNLENLGIRLKNVVGNFV